MQPPHNAPLAHHFADLEQQHESNTLGMWLFLATEILFFGAIFAGYIVYRDRYPKDFEAASKRLSVPLATTNTVILIGSSLTVVLAVHAAKHGTKRQVQLWLALTMVLGVAFLGVKAVEYTHDWHERLVPGRDYTKEGWAEGVNPAQTQLFFSFYYTMTGLHAVHMLIGLVVFAILWRYAGQGRYSARYYTPVEVAGLYWHFVDIVWVFLFPLLYLIRY